MPIIFSGISGIVLPGGIGWQEPFPYRFRIRTEPWLVLNDKDRGGGVFHKNSDNASFQVTLFEQTSNVSGHIFNMTIALHVK